MKFEKAASCGAATLQYIRPCCRPMYGLQHVVPHSKSIKSRLELTRTCSAGRKIFMVSAIHDQIRRGTAGHSQVVALRCDVTVAFFAFFHRRLSQLIRLLLLMTSRPPGCQDQAGCWLRTRAGDHPECSRRNRE